MKYFPNITTLVLIGQSIQKISDLEYCLLLRAVNHSMLFSGKLTMSFLSSQL